MNDIQAEALAVMDKLPALLPIYATKIVLAIVIYVIGKWLVGVMTRGMAKGMNARGVDETISTFVRNIIYYALLTIVVISALGQLGIQTASFVAVIGAAGLAVGFALQGSLSNFAAGVLIILFRPFKKGDYVEAGGTAGSVFEITILQTILKTPDNKTVIVANSSVLGNNITNYSTEPTRRVDLLVGVAYSADLALVKQELKAIADEEPRILTDKDIQIAVSALADSSVNLVFRVWVETPNYWPVFFDLTEKVKLRFDQKGIEIPFPQMDVHMKKEAA